MTAFLHPEHPHAVAYPCPPYPHCPDCSDYIGLYSEHGLDSNGCDPSDLRFFAIERARARLLDAILDDDDPESWAFWALAVEAAKMEPG